MLRFAAKRLAMLVPTLLLVTIVAFALSYFSPSDPVLAKYSFLGVIPDPQILEAERAAAGLNDPFLVQYLRWLGRALQGDLGQSYAYGADTAQEIGRRLPYTLALAVGAVIGTIGLAIPLGVVAAQAHGRWPDHIIRLVSFVGISMPSFWVALLLMHTFGVTLRWLPVMGSGSMRHLILPVLTLTMWLACLYVRRIRGAILDEMSKGYVEGALARGLPRRTVVWRHVLPNALASVLPLLGISIGALLGGATIVETIFEWPGIGKMVVAAVDVRDYPVILGYVVWVGFAFVVVNLLTDLAGYFLDPRSRRQATSS